MHTMHGDEALAAALSTVAALGTARDREQLMAVRDRIASQRLRVLVAGEAKRGRAPGECAADRAAPGSHRLPRSRPPCDTATIQDEVTFADGHEERHSLAALEDLVTERGNPGDRRGFRA